jgi:hypothetical protein
MKLYEVLALFMRIYVLFLSFVSLLFLDGFYTLAKFVMLILKSAIGLRI